MATIDIAPSAQDYFGYGQPTGASAVLPYGLGSGGALAPLPTGSANPSPAPFSPGAGMHLFTGAPSFWRSSGFGLFLLFLLIWYFDVRVVKR